MTRKRLIPRPCCCARFGDSSFSFSPFQPLALPSHVRTDWEDKEVSVTKFEGLTAYHSPWGSRSDDSCQLILHGEGSHHFTCTRAVFVHEQDDPALELLRAETLSEQGNRMIDKGVAENKPQESDLASRYTVRPRQIFLLISILCARPT